MVTLLTCVSVWSELASSIKLTHLISESTYKQTKDFIEVHKLDYIRVVGRATLKKIYELFENKKERLMNYLNSKWSEAKRKFKNILYRNQATASQSLPGAA